MRFSQMKDRSKKNQASLGSQTILNLDFSFPVIIHLEVASDSFSFLINSSWLLVFILYVFSLFISGFNLNSWKGIHFS